MQVSTPSKQALVDGSSLPDTPPPPSIYSSNKVKILALALFTGFGIAILTAGFFLSLKVIVFIGSFCTIASVATTIIGIKYLSTPEDNPKRNNHKEQDDIELIEIGDIELAIKKIESADFWKGVTQEEKKKALLKALLVRRSSLVGVPFKELDSSYLILAYETMREINSDGLKLFCIKFRCNELFEKMTHAEIYSQLGKEIMNLFAGHEELLHEELLFVKEFLKKRGIEHFDWESWKKFAVHHSKFILSILMDLQENPSEEKRAKVTDFVSNLFQKIDKLNFVGDKEAKLIEILSEADFEFSKARGENLNDGWKQKYTEFREKKAKENS